jgi:hypothetical protein
MQPERDADHPSRLVSRSRMSRSYTTLVPAWLVTGQIFNFTVQQVSLELSDQENYESNSKSKVPYFLCK